MPCLAEAADRSACFQLSICFNAGCHGVLHRGVGRDETSGHGVWQSCCVCASALFNEIEWVVWGHGRCCSIMNFRSMTHESPKSSCEVNIGSNMCFMLCRHFPNGGAQNQSSRLRAHRRASSDSGAFDWVHQGTSQKPLSLPYALLRENP